MSKKPSSLGRKKTRCAWVGEKPHFIDYHDTEWGRPVQDDHKHFEMLILEGAQAGLSWETILLRREGYRKAFANFSPEKVAKFGPKHQTQLLNNPGIIRNRLKISSAISNAKAFLAIQEECGSFNAYIWDFVGGKPRINHWRNASQVPATSPESDALARDLKKRGFRFAGSTIMYAHMQAAGLVNDHTTDCWLYSPKGFRATRIRSTEPPKRRRKVSLHPIQVKRIYEAPGQEDGYRVLIDRLWPRGIAKHPSPFNLWLKDIAPSTSLRKWFNHVPERWEEFQRRYYAELELNRKNVEELRRVWGKGSLTLLFGSRDLQHNHAIVLREYLLQRT